MRIDHLHPRLAAALGIVRCTAQAIPLVTTDWPELIEQAERQRLIPLLHDHLLQTGLFSTLPDSAHQALRSRLAEIAARQLSLTYGLTAILKRCKAAAIPCAPLRGPALTSMLAPSLSTRVMEDIDLLIPKRLLGTMVVLLADLGYRQIEQRPGFAQRFSYATSFVTLTPAPLCVDVHWTLAYPPHHDRIDMEGVWERAEQRKFDGELGWAISLPDLLIHLCAHWRHKGGRGPLLWLFELDQLIRRNRNLDWHLVRELARDSGQCPAVCKTLMELRDLYETPLPEWLLDRGTQSGLPSASLAESGPSEEWAQWASLPDLFTKLRYAGSLLWPSPEYMRWRYGVSGSAALLWAYLRRSVKLTWSVATWRMARLGSSVSRLSPRFPLFK